MSEPIVPAPASGGSPAAAAPKPGEAPPAIPTQAARFADQFRRAHGGEAWHGPALGELLAGVGAAAALARPLPEAHTIWEITLHATAWLELVARRLAGEAAQAVPPAVDWPPAPPGGEAQWSEVRGRLAASAEALREALLGQPEARLAEPVAGSGEAVVEMLLGALQHTAYHAGQVAILRKAAARSTAAQGEGGAS